MVLIFGAFLMLFGANKVPELMAGLGKGLKEFKKATREVTDELNSAMSDAPPPRKLPPATVAHDELAEIKDSPPAAPHDEPHGHDEPHETAAVSSTTAPKA